jgi:hypothetical protein
MGACDNNPRMRCFLSTFGGCPLNEFVFAVGPRFDLNKSRPILQSDKTVYLTRRNLNQLGSIRGEGDSLHQFSGRRKRDADWAGTYEL